MLWCCSSPSNSTSLRMAPMLLAAVPWLTQQFFSYWRTLRGGGNYLLGTLQGPEIKWPLWVHFPMCSSQRSQDDFFVWFNYPFFLKKKMLGVNQEPLHGRQVFFFFNWAPDEFKMQIRLSHTSAFKHSREEKASPGPRLFIGYLIQVVSPGSYTHKSH